MLTQRYINDILIIDVKGDVDIEKMEEIKNVISSLMDKDKHKVVLGLKNTKHINYSAINVLVERLQKLRQYHGDLKLVGVNDYLNNIFRVAGAYNQFDSYASVENAVKSFEEEGKD
ncbi:MAG: STAS domain-containing protein [Pseudomonadota bacterium]